jgi:hypothetical protein
MLHDIQEINLQFFTNFILMDMKYSSVRLLASNSCP